MERDESVHGDESDYEILPSTHSPMYLMHKYWARKPANIVRSYIERYCPVGGIVLDPFMGSGSTILEAGFCGRKAIGIDLNPLSRFITEETGKDTNLDCLNRAFRYLTNRITQNNHLFHDLYSIKCPKCDGEALISHLIWKNKTYLSRFERSNGIEDKFPFTDDLEEIRLKCSQCGNLIINELENTQWFQALKKVVIVREKDAPLLLQKEKLSFPEFTFQYENTTPFIQLRHSLRTTPQFHLLFPPINLVFLTYLKYEIENLPNEYSLVRSALLFCFTSALGQASKMVWVIEARKGKKLPRKQVGSWTHHFFWDPSEYFEINAWFCFVERFKKLIQGKKDVNLRRRQPGALIFNPAKNFDELSNQNPVLLSTKSATKLDLPDNCIDFVFTDPPYGDAIQYGELSSFWATFLGLDMKSYLQQIHDEEIIINSHQKKDLTVYKKKLTEAFSEIHRVLKPNSTVIITFHSTSFEIRNTLIEAVMESGLKLKQILHQMPPRMSVKSLLHYEGSPTGDYYIRFRKESSNGDTSIYIKDQVEIRSPKVIERHICEIISKILASRGEPTAEIWLTNLIDTFLCHDQLFPLPDFEIYFENIRKSGQFTITKDKYWWFSDLSHPDHIDSPLSDRIQKFLGELQSNNQEKRNKANQIGSTPQQYYFNEIYRHFRGVNTPDKYWINRLIGLNGK